MQAMQAPECLHRGQLWQYSAQYGGWLGIKLVLFNHALVVDPDGDAPSGAVTPRRKRRNSLKMWMDLCLVANIVRVQKEDGVEGLTAVTSAAGSAARRTSYTQGRGQQQSHRFRVETKDPEQVFRFATATEGEREEWVRCLLLAKKLRTRVLSAEAAAATSTSPTSTPMPKLGTAELADNGAFFRFASSESEDSDSDEENRSPSAHVGIAQSASPSWSDQNALRSAQLLAKHAPRPRVTEASPARSVASLVILQITAANASGASVAVSVPVTEASWDEISVHQVKTDAFKQLRKKLNGSANTTAAATSGFLKSVLKCDTDNFVLRVEGDEPKWLKDEERTIGYYIRDRTSRKIPLTLMPVNSMPLPTIKLAIVGTKNKVSDLSQKSYTAYVIDVSFDDMVWQLTRRFKEFYKLNCHLKNKYPNEELPRLPPKIVFTPLEGEFIDRRRAQLENYLKQVLQHPVLSTDVLLMSFLGVVSTSRDRELGQQEKSVIHVTTLHKSVACGDILLFSCRFGASRLQRKFTGSKYDHVGVVVPGESPLLLRIMEATAEGIQVYSLKTRLMAYSREVSNTIVVRRVKADRTPEVVEELTRFVERVEGNPYSIFGVLYSSGESSRQMIREKRGDGGPGSIASGSEEPDEAFYTNSSSTSSTRSYPASPSATDSDSDDSQAKKRKYFCSSLAASTLKHLGWLSTKRKSNSFWPGSFEDGGEIEQLMAPGVTLGPETVIDCRIVEVGLAVTQE